MALKLDPFAQRKLLDLAAADRVLAAARHRRANLPALTVLRETAERVASAKREVVLAQTEVSDLQRAMTKLDIEIDQVRGRAERNTERLQAGQAGPKELENLQRDIESLHRRQNTLEDEQLELMEQREAADATLAGVQQALAELEAQAAAAEAERDSSFDAIDAQMRAEEEGRARLAGSLPPDVIALYNRIAASGKVAAGELTGSQCGACRLDIDRTALSEIRTAPVDAVVRCSECGAILVRA
jgi:predicted  nucleic acid-binding Zn-ribbon protein